MFLALEFFPGVSRQNEYDFWKAYEQLFKLIINWRLNNAELGFYSKKTKSRSILGLKSRDLKIFVSKKNIFFGSLNIAQQKKDEKKGFISGHIRSIFPPFTP